jgi:hypothetical protein
VAVIWSPHAKERLSERARQRVPEVDAELAQKHNARDWEEWYEHDPREGRGVVLNRLVLLDSAQCWVLLRPADGGRNHVVASVLTPAQYDNNSQTMWSRSPGLAAPPPRATRDKPLTHSPFRALLRKSG